MAKGAKDSAKKYPGKPAACKQVPGEDGCKETFWRGKGFCLMCKSPLTADMRLGRKIGVGQK